VQGQTGLNVAAGIADIELEPVRLAHGALAGTSIGTGVTADSRKTPMTEAPAQAGLFVAALTHGKSGMAADVVS
jgi:hypothetical protein